MGLRTYIAICIDRSGSMRKSYAATLQGVNEQIAVIRKDAATPGMETYISLYFFNHNVEPQYKLRSVNLLEDVTEKDYIVDGDTAMFDCMGQAITDLRRETEITDPNNSYLVVMVSDGKERCSKRFTQDGVGALIKECTDSKQWTFSYLGANQNLGAVSKVLNISRGNMANYSADMKGSATAWKETNKKLGSFLKARRTGVQSTANFHSENDSISDYTKVDMTAVPDSFDYKSVNLEMAKPEDLAVDLDKLLKIKDDGYDLNKPKSFVNGKL